MAWFEKLTSFINIDLKGLKLINVNIAIIKDPKNKDKFTLSEEENKLIINSSALDETETNKLIEVVGEGFNAGEIDLLEEKSSERVSDIKKTSSSSETRRILEFYKDKISEQHWNALESSLYMRAVFRRGEPVGELKRDIVNKFGEDGRNISNLCSAGYFEGYIKQVYDEMAFQKEFTIDKFTSYFK